MLGQRLQHGHRCPAGSGTFPPAVQTRSPVADPTQTHVLLQPATCEPMSLSTAHASEEVHKRLVSDQTL
ncbi:hypothetical protein WOLCODRAFT_23049 [Wolfiporia cocos MD-104 SS10]|uniref:Uncharacterized protein n=1 Tax=Wolfiporia cocos (strain MD-104) TaxID=742152 RepID=A0A2H3J722_WOLCO|nr:hypothetical protein WOLCODRAFT_23049 [Wolfiporia cocos MD-104 SS10]